LARIIANDKQLIALHMCNTLYFLDTLMPDNNYLARL